MSNEPKDAATVLLVRGDQPCELFMVRRGQTAAFMPNAMVFPGGRLDDDDCDDALVACCALDRPAAAARLGLDDGARALGLLVAAVRETFEEAGVLLATRGGVPVDPQTPELQAHRDALNAGERTILEVAQAAGLTLQVDQLGFLARWITPPLEMRRYDTFFLTVRAPAHQRPTHDRIETTASAWLTAQDAVTAYEAREIDLAPPTYRILLELVGRDAETLLAPRPTPAAIQPKAHASDGGFMLALPGDVDYDPPGEGRNRFTLQDGRWISEGAGF